MSDIDLKNGNYETLSQWISIHHTEEEMREVFLNMDRALKYIHEHGYCVEKFYPTQILVLNDKIDHIKFLDLIELPFDISQKKEWIKEDIFRSCFIQVAFYSNSLKYLTPEFLKENFDSFVQFIPAKDVPYYRGIVQRNASVYFCEYALEQRNRDLEELSRQMGEEGEQAGNQSGKQLLKKIPGISSDIDVIDNNNVNDILYRDISGLNDTAFVNFILIPIIVLLVLSIIFIVMFFIN